ncbi:entericidin A/B family lipoprotein [Janthinobacterium sp. 17J80-10]|nr:entericidin A/B family lipoprotein [Janthinobacterium sp. 17J80-10]QAU34739.1 entericidin A/B family lipoprotein [Janthinobacterium sp. 17J80-10]
MKKIFVFLLSVVLLNACNTIEGVGKDVKKAGSVVEEAARR